MNAIVTYTVGMGMLEFRDACLSTVMRQYGSFFKTKEFHLQRVPDVMRHFVEGPVDQKWFEAVTSIHTHPTLQDRDKALSDFDLEAYLSMPCHAVEGACAFVFVEISTNEMKKVRGCPIIGQTPGTGSEDVGFAGSSAPNFSDGVGHDTRTHNLHRLTSSDKLKSNALQLIRTENGNKIDSLQPETQEYCVASVASRAKGFADGKFNKYVDSFEKCVLNKQNEACEKQRQQEMNEKTQQDRSQEELRQTIISKLIESDHVSETLALYSGKDNMSGDADSNKGQANKKQKVSAHFLSIADIVNLFAENPESPFVPESVDKLSSCMSKFTERIEQLPCPEPGQPPIMTVKRVATVCEFQLQRQ